MAAHGVLPLSFTSSTAERKQGLGKHICKHKVDEEERGRRDDNEEESLWKSPPLFPLFPSSSRAINSSIVLGIKIVPLFKPLASLNGREAIQGVRRDTDRG